MSYFKLIGNTFAFLLCSVLLSSAVWAFEPWPDPRTYTLSYQEMMKQKGTFDDNTDMFVTFHPKDFLPPEMWKRVHWDIAQMQGMWAELLGFKAPDLVGKIAPEIKPGKYTYKDLERYPGLKELFPPYIVPTIKAGGPPIICNVIDFEIEATRQFHMALPVAQLTKENLGRAKLDKEGYIVPRSWQGGYPFPKPSGKFKAQQVYYNFEKKCVSYDENYLLTGEGLSFDRNLKIDKYMAYSRKMILLMGRAFMEPYGWFDKRAEKRGEFKTDLIQMYEPRANRGTIRMLMKYDDPYKLDPFLIYIPQMRRIRKMSATDTQDPQGDATYDDTGFLNQKITPKRYPYKFEIIGEREYLLPFEYNSAKTWVDSKNGYGLRDLGVTRRPCYILQMTQLDPNYVYSKRVYYIDKETFLPGGAEFYDQKGRLYRTYNITRSFLPECGQLVTNGTPAWQVDYLDTHSSTQMLTVMPAQYQRTDFNLGKLVKGK